MSVADTVPLVTRYAPDTEAHLASLDVLRQAEQGIVTVDQIRHLLVAEFACQQAEIGAYGLVLARFPDERFAGYFLAVQQGLLAAREAVLVCGQQFGLTRSDFADTPLPAGAEQFTGLVSWLALHSGPGEMALVTRNDWLLYCAACGRLGDVLARAGRPEIGPAVSYLQGYGTVPERVRDGTHSVVDDALSLGESESSVCRSTHLVEPALGALWRGVASA